MGHECLEEVVTIAAIELLDELEPEKEKEKEKEKEARRRRRRSFYSSSLAALLLRRPFRGSPRKRPQRARVCAPSLPACGYASGSPRCGCAEARNRGGAQSRSRGAEQRRGAEARRRGGAEARRRGPLSHVARLNRQRISRQEDDTAPQDRRAKDRANSHGRARGHAFAPGRPPSNSCESAQQPRYPRRRWTSPRNSTCSWEGAPDCAQ